MWAVATAWPAARAAADADLLVTSRAAAWAATDADAFVRSVENDLVADQETPPPSFGIRLRISERSEIVC
jgi:hypothetical protein